MEGALKKNCFGPVRLTSTDHHEEITNFLESSHYTRILPQMIEKDLSAFIFNNSPQFTPNK